LKQSKHEIGLISDNNPRALGSDVEQLRIRFNFGQRPNWFGTDDELPRNRLKSDLNPSALRQNY